MSLWYGQVEIAEDLQLAVGPAHILALDCEILLSSRQRGLQVSLHALLLQLEERGDALLDTDSSPHDRLLFPVKNHTTR